MFDNPPPTVCAHLLKLNNPRLNVSWQTGIDKAAAGDVQRVCSTDGAVRGLDHAGQRLVKTPIPPHNQSGKLTHTQGSSGPRLTLNTSRKEIVIIVILEMENNTTVIFRTAVLKSNINPAVQH